MKRRETGILGERLAKDFLKKKRYRIIETNFKCQYGEIDIIARKNEYLVFIEVRTKTSCEFGSPEESITPMKKDKIIASASSYINTHQTGTNSWRIDFVAIEVDQKGKLVRAELIENITG